MGSLAELFAKGVDAYKDIEISKNYAANDARPGTRAADGSAVPQGVSGAGTTETLTTWAKSPIGIAVGVAIAAAVFAFVLARR